MTITHIITHVHVSVLCGHRGL